MESTIYNRKLVTRLRQQYMLIIIVIVICIAFAISFVSGSILRKMALQSNVQELELVSQRMDTLLSKVESESMMFITSDRFQKSFVENQLHSPYQGYLYAASINSALLQFIVVQPNLQSVIFVDVDDTWFCRNYSGEAFHIPAWLVRQLEVFHQSAEQTLWYLPALDSQQSTPQILLLRKAYSFEGKLRGFLIFQLSQTAINGIVPDSISRQGDFLIYNQQRQPCMLLSEAYTISDVAAYPNLGSTNTMTQVEPGLFLTQKEFIRSGLILGILTPSSIIYRNIYVLVSTTIVIGLLLLGLSLAMVSAAAKHQLQPLDDIIDAIKRMSCGDYEAKLTVATRDELQYLSDQINSMADNTLHLMQEIRRNEEQKKQYELAYLQLQMQPHFLYNTLESLNGMIEVNDKRQAIEMTVQVARFYRQILTHDCGDAIITIEKELEIAESYLRIMQMRYHGLFHFHFDIAPEIASCKIPKLLLQPLLENSIIHGFSGMEMAYGMLRIAGRKTNDDRVCLIVEDNGRGIPTTQLKMLQAGGKKASFGLQGVQERIRIYFGSTAQLTIESQLGHGTRITIQLPLN